MLQRTKYVGYVILIILIFNVDLMAQKLYFSGPRESVSLTSKLLTEENWEQLSYFYYLENADEEVIDSLKNGSYFIRTKRPEVAHPGGFWKYKNPFPPGFNYLSHSEVATDTIKVEVTIEIDQGNGRIQQGLDSFYLKKSKKGYQLIL
jgi:hypothetical protein